MESKWHSLDVEVLSDKDVVRNKTPVIKKGVNWKPEHSTKEFVIATVGELSEWKFYAMADQTNMGYISFEEEITRNCMLSKKWLTGESRILITMRCTRRKRDTKSLKSKHPARIIG